jgi:hypothetical protein
LIIKRIKATILHVQECIHKHVDICGTQRMSVTHFIRYDNQEWTIQRNWQQDEDKHNKIPVGHQHSQTQKNTIRHGPSYKQLEVKQSQKIERPNNLRDFQSIKQTTKGLNMIAQICQGHLCL